MTLLIKGLAFSFTLTISAFAMDFSTESLIFNPTKITMAFKNSQAFSETDWLQAVDQADNWIKTLPFSNRENYQKAEKYYVSKIGSELEDLTSAVQQKKLEFVFPSLEKLAEFEDCLRTLQADAKLATQDLTLEDLQEIKRVSSHEEKVHKNLSFPPEEDRCFEAIVVKRTRFGNTEVEIMAEIATSELVSPAIISFAPLTRLVQGQDKTSGITVTASQEPSVAYNYGVTTKTVVQVDEYKQFYTLTSDSFYRGSDFRIKYNKDSGFLFLQDVAILGETTSLKSVAKGGKSKTDAKLLKQIENDDSTKMPKKIDLIFDFDLGKEDHLAVQMRFLQTKSSLFRNRDGDVAEWIVNFVRGKDVKKVTDLMNNYLLKKTN